MGGVDVVVDGDGDEMAQRGSRFGRRWAEQCAAIVDALDVLSDLEDAKREQASELLERIVTMLTKLCR